MSAGVRTIGMNRTLVCAPFKVGSTSVQDWCSNAGVEERHIDPRKAPMKPVVAFIRDPVMRVQSAWRMFQFKHASFPAPHRGKKPYEEFVDRVLSGYTNPHWDEQASAVAGMDMVLPFEAMPHLWPLIVKGQGGDGWRTAPSFPHQNPTEPVELDFDYRLQELDRFYADDHAARARAWTLYDFIREGFAPEVLPPCEKERESATRARTPRSTSAA